MNRTTSSQLPQRSNPDSAGSLTLNILLNSATLFPGLSLLAEETVETDFAGTTIIDESYCADGGGSF